jgi:hypothetical protein
MKQTWTSFVIIVNASTQRRRTTFSRSQHVEVKESTCCSTMQASRGYALLQLSRKRVASEENRQHLGKILTWFNEYTYIKKLSGISFQMLIHSLNHSPLLDYSHNASFPPTAHRSQANTSRRNYTVARAEHWYVRCHRVVLVAEILTLGTSPF